MTAISILLTATLLLAAEPGDWPQFRGPDNRSVSDATNLPDRVVEQGTDAAPANVAWKAPLPGGGPSSPIVVGQKVFVTAASGVRNDRLHVLAFDAETGRQLWHRQLWATGHTLIHNFGGVAAPTPASDGQRVFAFFSSNDLACFDLDGHLLWLRGLAYENPTTRNDVGMSSSPLVVGDVVIVQLENQGESFAAGIDAATGETRWRHEREKDAMWTSPTVLRGETRTDDLVLMQSRNKLTAHRALTGQPVWQYEASSNTIASVTVDGHHVYLPALGLHSLRYSPTDKAVKLLWHENRLRSGNASPVVFGGRTYTLKPPGILVCGDAADGSVLWQLRLTGPFWATPVAADGRLYCISHRGLLQVVTLSDQRPDKPVESQIDAGILASPAVTTGAIYLRSNEHLWKVVKP